MPLRAEWEAAGGSAATVASTTPGQTSILKIRLADESKASVAANSFIKGYAVLVTDSAGLPVADAAVALRLPDEGATGFFLNGEHSAVAYTDASGVAKFPQVNWGSAPGTVYVRVTAVKGELHAGALIEQTITPQIQPATAVAAIADKPATLIPAPADGSIPVVPTVPAAKTPGTPTSVAAVHSAAAPAEAANSTADPANADKVSVVTTAGSQAHSNTKKWLIVAAVVAGAGVGAALALAGHGGAAASTTASSTTTIGGPSVSVGH